MLATDFRCTLAQRHGFLALGQQCQGATAELHMRNRALQKVGGTRIERRQPALPVLMCCDNNRGNLACPRHHPDLPDEFRTVHLWHAIVDNHQVGAIVTKPIQRFDRIRISDGGIFFPHQRDKLGINPQISWSIIDYQNARVHDWMHYRRMFNIRLTPASGLSQLLFGKSKRLERPRLSMLGANGIGLASS